MRTILISKNIEAIFMNDIKDLDQKNAVAAADNNVGNSKFDESLTIQEENKHRILVMAPADDVRHRLTGLLERENNTVVEFDETIDVLEHLQSLTQPEETQLVSMLIIDWSLSDSSLPKLIRHLQQAPFSNLPLVAITDSPCIEIKEALMFLKHTSVIQKPIKTNDLLSILQKFLLQPTLATTSKSADTDYYNFLESNTLLELAIKNHKNGSATQLQHESVSENLN